MKAGTAQKVVLNVLSTGAMVRTGKSYGAWMVDLRAANDKLRRRAQRILTEATGVSDEEALAALEAAGWRTKTALVAILARVDAASAENALTTSDGRARDAVALLTGEVR
jgi:N-acetylmuramic acid 6-phosphate etherase